MVVRRTNKNLQSTGFHGGNDFPGCFWSTGRWQKGSPGWRRPSNNSIRMVLVSWCGRKKDSLWRSMDWEFKWVLRIFGMKAGVIVSPTCILQVQSLMLLLYIARPSFPFLEGIERHPKVILRTNICSMHLVFHQFKKKENCIMIWYWSSNPSRNRKSAPPRTIKNSMHRK